MAAVEVAEAVVAAGGEGVWDWESGGLLGGVGVRVGMWVGGEGGEGRRTNERVAG